MLNMKKIDAHLLLNSSIRVTTILPPILFSLPFTTSGGGHELGSGRPPSPVLYDWDLLRRSEIPGSTGLHVLDLIDAGSLQPNYDLYSQLVKSCTESLRLEDARLVHAHFLASSSFKADVFFETSVVNMFAKCGAMEDAQKMFDGMPIRNIVTWTALITGYAQKGPPRKALELLPWMVEVGLLPNHFTFASLFKAAGGCECEEFGKQMHALCAKCGCDQNVFVGSSILDMYARCGRMEEACLVFDRLDCKNEVSWNALIAGYEREGDGEIALRKFWEMHRSGAVATHFTYSSAFGACAAMGSLQKGRWVHSHMIKQGHRTTSFVGNTLLDMYAKSGSIEDAKKVFERLAKRDIVSWNSMLKGYAQHGLGNEAVKLFDDMLKIGMKPSGITFLCVLNACSHSGLLNQGKRYFDLMKKYKLEPGVEHYATMVDLLGRAGLLDQAQIFIREMPIQPTAAVWGALLGACRMHKNAELGKIAAKPIFELDPCDSGPPILLSNIYSSAGRWEEAARVRKMMKDSGIKKEPACSWVEIGSNVHMFVADDDSHPQSRDIHNMWEKVSAEIKEAGYVPDTSYVLLHLDEKEREVKLQHHSEKLALAFALLSTPTGATIHIKKNIRMCGDCHSAFKFVTKVMDREVVVRDTKRFHHFNHGSCSCGDYW